VFAIGSTVGLFFKNNFYGNGTTVGPFDCGVNNLPGVITADDNSGVAPVFTGLVHAVRVGVIPVAPGLPFGRHFFVLGGVGADVEAGRAQGAHHHRRAGAGGMPPTT